jgi:hypothetical protein
MATYSDPLGFKNYGFDQIMANKGHLNFCVRWESSESVTAAQRADVEVALQRSVKKWMDKLVDFEGFPYSSVPVKVVGWAVSDTSLLQGSTDGIDVYTTKDEGGIPQCDPRCGRFFHQDGDYASCPGGAERHYGESQSSEVSSLNLHTDNRQTDQSLWLTEGFEGGAGGDWGQRIGRSYFMDNLNTDSIHILLHEIGHTFALDG